MVKTWILFRSFLRLGITAFGGPAMIAHIRDLAVDRHQWLSENEFRNGVVLSQSIPGATAMQVAAYTGLRAGGIMGALASYIGFGLPAFVLMLVLAMIYARFGNLPWFLSIFRGLQIIVVAIIFHAVYSFSGSIYKKYRLVLLSLLSALLFWLGVSPFIVVVAGAVAGMVLITEAPASSASANTENQPHLNLALALLLLFAAGMAGLYFINSRLFDLAAIMLKVDLFAFGGGFASVPLMLQEIVINKGWLDSRTFMDGIALGQITPGPIVITATFTGYLLQGIPGAVIATLAIFTPSFFLLIFTVPYFDRLKTSLHFSRVTQGIYASFVGLLLYAGINFASAVHWNWIGIVLGAAAFTALVCKVDILYVVLAAMVFSFFAI
jgi:chromate transporter